MKLVLQEEIKMVQKNLEAMPVTAEELTSDWITKSILNKEERTTKHTIFWLLLDGAKSGKLEAWLSILKSSLPDTKFTRIINSLKERKDENEFNSILPEVEVLAYYASQKDKGVEVEYQPNIPGKPKVGDIKLSFDGNEVYLEITRVFSSKEEKRIDDTLHLLGSKIDEIANNPFVITIAIEENFTETDVNPFIELVKSQIEKYRGMPEFPGKKIYHFDYEPKGSFRFIMRAPNGKKGYAGGFHTPVMEIKTAGRLKGKIMDKIEQLPENRLNVIVLDISHHFAHFEDIEDSFAGQEGVRINVDTGEATLYRNANGIIHVDEGRQIGAIIGFKEFEYANRRKYINLSAIAPFNDEILSKL